MRLVSSIMVIKNDLPDKIFKSKLRMLEDYRLSRKIPKNNSIHLNMTYSESEIFKDNDTDYEIFNIDLISVGEIFTTSKFISSYTNNILEYQICCEKDYFNSRAYLIKTYGFFEIKDIEGFEFQNQIKSINVILEDNFSRLLTTQNEELTDKILKKYSNSLLITIEGLVMEKTNSSMIIVKEIDIPSGV